MDDDKPDWYMSKEQLESHYAGAIGHYTGVIVKLEAQLQEAKHLKSTYSQRLKSLLNPKYKGKRERNDPG
jgi:hypothetical protein